MTGRLDPKQVEGWSREDDPEADPDWRAAFDETMTLDPAIQIAGEEDKELPQKIRDLLKLIPESSTKSDGLIMS